MNENTILRTVPAASELHKVPGFDPTRLPTLPPMITP